MIIPLFSSPLYKAVDTKCVELGQFWFIQAAPHLIDNYNTIDEGKNVPYRSTLISVYPGKTHVSWDPMQSPEWKEFEDFISEHVARYLQEAGYNYYIPRIVNCWLNEMPARSRNSMHSHHGYSISGTYYIDVPQDSGHLRVQRTRHPSSHFLSKIRTYTLENSDDWLIDIEPGAVVLHASELLHGVPEKDYEGQRRSISFDIVLIPTKRLPPDVIQAVKDAWGVDISDT
jgi:uncharacterized protein (TIGR02466 family)